MINLIFYPRSSTCVETTVVYVARGRWQHQLSPGQRKCLIHKNMCILASAFR